MLIVRTCLYSIQDDVEIATASRLRRITSTLEEKLAFAHHLDSDALPAHSIAPIGEFAHHTFSLGIPELKPSRVGPVRGCSRMQNVANH